MVRAPDAKGGDDVSGERFTAWLAGNERVTLRALSVHLGCSENFILRVALRAVIFGNPIPAYMREAVTEVTQVTDRNTTQNHVTGARA